MSATEQAEKTITVPEAALGIVLAEASNDIPPGADHRYRNALADLTYAWRAAHEEDFRAMITPDPEPPLPEGIFGRVELPGYRQHTGWITEEPRFGQQAAVVRDWNGAEIAVAVLGPGCQVVVLPTPRKRPDPPQAIAAGRYDDDGNFQWSGSGDDDDDDDPDDDYR